MHSVIDLAVGDELSEIADGYRNGDRGRGNGPELLRKTDVLIVDDCTLYRECLVGVLAGRIGAAATGVAADLASVITEMEVLRPRVILLNIATHESVMLLRQVLRYRPDASLVVIGVSEDDDAAIVECAEAGVAGYHLRTDSLEDLVNLIQTVAAGESACSSRVSGVLLRRLSELAAQRQPAAREVVLTTREIEILRMLEAGMANREIADKLCIAVHTVKNHVHSILTKLGVSTREQAAALARNMSATDWPRRD
ncbi:response regulator transcription factor [Mycobacterium sp. ITM-2016-00317]|uniref:response regulator transcription factor n=1 Tax=Mycobacterium sp. ITM-2016-00317 TaxID=2099694 RepID=UPI00287FB61A|nr:response regulator transcription factor [Mycobacterium sp. ITM-2016-00317]WNG86978.1 response regulator transcription factor [Mycobacterium sp. ITM-2016-00317]